MTHLPRNRKAARHLTDTAIPTLCGQTVGFMEIDDQAECPGCVAEILGGLRWTPPQQEEGETR